MRTAPWRGVTDWNVGRRAGQWIRSPSTSCRKKRHVDPIPPTHCTQKGKNAKMTIWDVYNVWNCCIQNQFKYSCFIHLSIEFTAFFCQSSPSRFFLFLFCCDSPSTSEPRPSEPKATGQRQTSVQGALQRLARCWSSSTALCKSQRPIEIFCELPRRNKIYATWISTCRLKTSQNRLQQYIAITILIEKKWTALFSQCFLFSCCPLQLIRKNHGALFNLTAAASHCIRNQELRDRNAWANTQLKIRLDPCRTYIYCTYTCYTYYRIRCARGIECAHGGAHLSKKTQHNTSMVSACDFLGAFSKHVQHININWNSMTVWQYLHLCIRLEDDINLRKCDLKFLSYHLDPLEQLGLKPAGLERCFTTTTPGSPTLLNTAHVVVDEVLHWREINCDFQSGLLHHFRQYIYLVEHVHVMGKLLFLPRLPEILQLFFCKPSV